MIDVLVIVFLAAGGILRGWQARRAWLDPQWVAPAELGLLLAPLGRRARLGAPRSIAVQPVLLFSAALVMAIASATHRMGHGSSRSLTGLALLAVVGVLAGGCLIISTVWLSWPKWIIPPQFRSSRDGRPE